MTDTSALHLTVASRVAEHLRSEIRRGVLPAGAPLRQNEVASRLGVSSTPVREAFQMLERQGLVTREGRRGVQVVRPSTRDLMNTYEVRGALEGLAARLAAVQLSDAQIAEITKTMRQMHSPRVAQDAFLRLNTLFHTQIAQGCGNARLADLIVAEQASTTSFVVFLGVDPSSAHEAEGEHQAILDALAARDAPAAALAMSTHLVARVDALRERLDAAEESAEVPVDDPADGALLNS